MKMFLYSVKDDDFAFSQPFVYPTDALAIRAFVGSCRSESPNLANTNPEKKSLWRVGEFDDQTGLIVSSELILLAKAVVHVLSEEERAERETARKVSEMVIIQEQQEKINSLEKQNKELYLTLQRLESKKSKKEAKKCKKLKK